MDGRGRNPKLPQQVKKVQQKSNVKAILLVPEITTNLWYITEDMCNVSDCFF